MSALPIPRFSAEEYLQFDRNSETKHEYLDGTIIAMVGGSPRHGLIAMQFAGLVVPKLLAQGCKPFSSDVRVQIQAKRAYVYPDFSVTCGPVEYSESAWDSICNPSLIVEVLSPGTASHDRGTKAYLYHMIPSLQDLLLIHQEPVWIEHHSRQSPQSWHIEIIEDEAATISLRSIQQNVAVADIYAGVREVPTGAQ